jgi:hypothetical protein
MLMIPTYPKKLKNMPKTYEKRQHSRKKFFDLIKKLKPKDAKALQKKASVVVTI